MVVASDNHVDSHCCERQEVTRYDMPSSAFKCICCEVTSWLYLSMKTRVFVDRMQYSPIFHRTECQVNKKRGSNESRFKCFHNVLLYYIIIRHSGIDFSALRGVPFAEGFSNGPERCSGEYVLLLTASETLDKQFQTGKWFWIAFNAHFFHGFYSVNG